MTEPAKPLPCPFCGDSFVTLADSEVPNPRGGQKQAVFCNGCFCEGPTAHHESDAMDFWNHRFPDARLAQAEKALAELRAIAEGLAAFIKEDEDRIYDEVNKQAHNLTEAFDDWKKRNV